MSHIIDNLFIGSYEDAVDYDFLYNNQIACVINVAAEVTLTKHHNIDYYHFLIYDNANFDIQSFFEPIHKIIKSYSPKHILINCYAGISRSVTCVISYLIKYYHMSYQQSLYLIKQSRPFVQPNYGFVNQLLIYQNTLKNSSFNYCFVLSLIFILLLCFVKIPKLSQ